MTQEGVAGANCFYAFSIWGKAPSLLFIYARCRDRILLTPFFDISALIGPLMLMGQVNRPHLQKKMEKYQASNLALLLSIPNIARMLPDETLFITLRLVMKM